MKVKLTLPISGNAGVEVDKTVVDLAMIQLNKSRL